MNPGDEPHAPVQPLANVASDTALTERQVDQSPATERERGGLDPFPLVVQIKT